MQHYWLNQCSEDRACILELAHLAFPEHSISFSVQLYTIMKKCPYDIFVTVPVQSEFLECARDLTWLGGNENHATKRPHSGNVKGNLNYKFK